MHHMLVFMGVWVMTGVGCVPSERKHRQYWCESRSAKRVENIVEEEWVVDMDCSGLYFGGEKSRLLHLYRPRGGVETRAMWLDTGSTPLDREIEDAKRRANHEHSKDFAAKKRAELIQRGVITATSAGGVK